jgi:hypothetical protein
MRLDHVSYAASHDQISDVVNRIGSQIGTAFIDGGIHPKFGTRNFTAPLLNGQYIEVVCSLDHPATELTPFGRAVKKKSEEGGGWMSWVLAVDDISKIETSFGRSAMDGERKKPNGSILKWRQIGVIEVLEDFSQPFFVEWVSKDHPGKDGAGTADLFEIVFEANQDKSLRTISEHIDEITKNLKLEFITPESTYIGIKEIKFKIDGQEVVVS